MTTKIERLGRAAADGWIAATGDLTPRVEAQAILAARDECNLPVEEDLCDDDGNRIPAECEEEFEAAFWGRIEEVAR